VKSLDWKSILEQHSIFSLLSESETERLLDEVVSKERKYKEGDTILTEGDSDDSVYLIGSGEVEVVLLGKGEDKIHLNTLREGEYFGEMAVFERHPRSATVIAAESCVLLEIAGREFLNLVSKHPEIEVKVIGQLSARLRRVGRQIIKGQRDLHEEVAFLNTRMDLQSRETDATLKATQTVFEQTNKRANEIIDSADRSRTRLTVAASAAGTIIAAVVTVLGFLGISEVENIREKGKEIREIEEWTKNEGNKIEILVKEAADDAQKIKETSSSLASIQEEVGRFEQFYRDSLVTQFEKEMSSSGDEETALQLYREILNTKDELLIDKLFKGMNREISYRAFAGQNLEPYRAILITGINGRYATTERQTILSYYLLLASYMLDSHLLHNEREEYERFNKELSTYVENSEAKSKDKPIKESLIKDFDVSTFRNMIHELKLDEKTSKDRIERIDEVWEQIP